jgi:hypothetical protein
MALALSVLCVLFAALSIWLTVRTLNRRERWAKWIFAALLVWPVLYVVSLGPVCWWTAKPVTYLIKGGTEPVVSIIYSPLGWASRLGHNPIRKGLNWWITVGMQADTVVMIPVGLPGQRIGVRTILSTPP